MPAAREATVSTCLGLLLKPGRGSLYVGGATFSYAMVYVQRC
jgi:hypothetical protein